MFEDSLLESHATSLTLRGNKTRAAAASLAIEFTVVALLVVLPLVFTQTLPKVEFRRPAVPITFGLLPMRAAEAPAHTSAVPAAPTQSPITAPAAIPQNTAIVADLPAASPSGAATEATGQPGGSPDGVVGSGSGVPASGFAVTPAPRPALLPAQPSRIAVSAGVTDGLLIRRVQPFYPSLARMSRVSGRVLIHAVIGRDGTIQNMQVVSGNPLLIQSAVDAVRQWRYRPYLLNGEPVEVDTEIAVNFTLGA